MARNTRTHEPMKDPATLIAAALEDAEHAEKVGMFRIKTANQAIADAARRPDPEDLYHELWFEGEVCCLFADSNLGKSIYAVQMADEIALTRPVLYIDCELSDKQFQMRYTDQATGYMHPFPPQLYRAEIDPLSVAVKDYEALILGHIEQAALRLNCKTVIVDNIGYLCNSADKGTDAGTFMQNLLLLKRKYGWSLLIIAHTPKRSLSSPITQNDLAGSKKLFNFFDSVFAIGKSAKDESLRYVKQVKVRAGAFRYDAGNVMVYEIVKEAGFVHFKHLAFATEREHLSEQTEKASEVRDRNIIEMLEQQKPYREIAEFMGVSIGLVSKVAAKWKAKNAENNENAVNTVNAVNEPDPSLFPG